MNVIEKDVLNEIEIQKSRFITFLFRVNDVCEVVKKIDEVKVKYPGATHYCYSYIIGSYQKASDDREPSGTAGMPILEVLKKRDLTQILCVVVRYFGGIKLGAGGLIRAYSSSCKEALDKANILSLVPGYKVLITVPYDKTRELDYFLKDIRHNKTYELLVNYEIFCKEDIKNELEKKYSITYQSIDIEEKKEN